MAWFSPHKYIIDWKSELKPLLWSHAVQRPTREHLIDGLFDRNSLVPSLCVKVDIQCQVITALSTVRLHKKTTAVKKHIHWSKTEPCYWLIPSHHETLTLGLKWPQGNLSFFSDGCLVLIYNGSKWSSFSRGFKTSVLFYKSTYSTV